MSWFFFLYIIFVRIHNCQATRYARFVRECYKQYDDNLGICYKNMLFPLIMSMIRTQAET